MEKALTPGQVKVLALAAEGRVDAFTTGLVRPFGMCIRQGLIRKGVITALGRAALEDATKAGGDQ